MQRYTMTFITINALPLSGGFFAHHQELKTVYTASGICRAFTAYCLRELGLGSPNSLTQGVRSSKSLTNT